METAAVPAETTRPGPLAALALVVAVPATLALASWATVSVTAWLGPLVAACGLAVILLIGRSSFGVARTLVLAVTTGWAFAAASGAFVVLFVVDVFTSCNGGVSHSLPGSVVVLAGVAYAVTGFWALRKGWWWALPLAVVVAFVLGAVLTYALPGVPHPEPCSD
jgi:hypothetical protein